MIEVWSVYWRGNWPFALEMVRLPGDFGYGLTGIHEDARADGEVLEQLERQDAVRRPVVAEQMEFVELRDGGGRALVLVACHG